MVETVNSDFELQLRDKRTIVNNMLRKLLAGTPSAKNRVWEPAQDIGIDLGPRDNDLREAIKYTLEAPGKRIRSALVLQGYT